MEEQLKSVAQVLNSINALNDMVYGDEANIPPDHALKLINNYADSLKQVYNSGNAAYYPIPLDLLKFIDTPDISNPELYMHKVLEDSDASAKLLCERKEYVKEVKDAIISELQKERTKDT